MQKKYIEFIKNNKTEKRSIVYACVAIPVVVANGVLSGISSVVASYFFKPVWNKIVEWWKNES